ncbi:MAG: bifunctional 5,10-methylenetetrahydrofolate dehydrogenase/5,10-methenyltetrahydrofolate cyclohydrolase [Candidatus Thermoplasmatota archaeon]|jgi:methylenetetrahydrofolate dehydrogenase (NADP+)/methenyltetrahydrofolate cyclohydrolase|nr:bifunctional 5,10-methylenetetrahydrofolate dehydrogenase/5,10-methenyltetrahydrofolate cyclohydrolase [Candidatus Thermoplasmatota archaeon]MCL5785569.1 bifunctional 5,10-methylenetetrahydrofolate dehydrogenase/5,10-methenyltetrahydrofolate cyclohydrolase [Candidatus Thermoplasmatota archaeon]
MRLQIIDCKAIADSLRSDLQFRFNQFYEAYSRKPVMAVLMNRDASEAMSYMKSRRTAAAKLGAEIKEIEFQSGTGKEEILAALNEVSHDSEVQGVMVSLPVPKSFSEVSFGSIIPPEKDVDCITPWNQGLIMQNREFVTPATASAVIEVMISRKIPEGSRIAIVNRSPIIGRPLAMMLLNRHYSPAVCHTRTTSIKEVTRSSEVLVTAAGRARIIDESWVSGGQTVIDVGINSLEGKIVGDVNADSLRDKDITITPVPGGVGPITSLMLFRNLLTCANAIESATEARDRT